MPEIVWRKVNIISNSGLYCADPERTDAERTDPDVPEL